MVRFAVAAAALVLLPATAGAQSPAERLAWFEGDWVYDEIEGEVSCDLLGQHIVHCQGSWVNAAGNSVEAVFITRYDEVEDEYRAYRFYNGGYADVALGWVDGDDWTFVYEGREGTLNRFTAQADETSWTYAWHRSVRGGPWEETSRGSMTKTN